MLYIPQLLLILFLILMSAFFTAAEYALIAVRKTRIDTLANHNHRLAKIVRTAMLRREEYISTTLIGQTTISLTLGWIGEPILSSFIRSLFFIRPDPVVTGFVSIVFSFAVLTSLSILLGELLPKTAALYRSEAIAFMTILPMSFFLRLFWPLTRVLNGIEWFILRLLGISRGKSELSQSKEELRVLMDEVTKTGIISADERQIVNNVFQMNERTVRQLLKPRSEIHALDGAMTVEHVVRHINSHFSRYPVYLHTIDNIIGFIHIKDFYRVPDVLLKKKLSKSGLLRMLISVPDTKKVNEVFLDMRRRHVHMAIVYSEFGTVLGMVTLEDIVESVLGDIQDEFDRSISSMRRNSDGSYQVEGNTPLKLFTDRFHLGPVANGNTTIGGFIFGMLGHEPHIGDKVAFGNFHATVTATKGKRVTELRLSRFPPPRSD